MNIFSCLSLVLLLRLGVQCPYQNRFLRGFFAADARVLDEQHIDICTLLCDSVSFIEVYQDVLTCWLIYTPAISVSICRNFESWGSKMESVKVALSKPVRVHSHADFTNMLRNTFQEIRICLACTASLVFKKIN